MILLNYEEDTMKEKIIAFIGSIRKYLYKIILIISIFSIIFRILNYFNVFSQITLLFFCLFMIIFTFLIILACIVEFINTYIKVTVGDVLKLITFVIIYFILI